MAMANMNLIGLFVTKLWPVQALACGGGGDQKHNITEIFKFRGYNNMLSLTIAHYVKMKQDYTYGNV